MNNTKDNKNIETTKLVNDDGYIDSGRMTEGQRKIVSIIGMIIFVVFMLGVGYYVGIPMVENFENPEKFREWVEGFGAFGGLACIGMMILQIVVAIIPGGVFEIGAGYAFGAIEGGIFCIIGSILGSAMVFLFVRYFGIKLIEAFFSVEKIRNLKFLKDEKRRNILAFVIFLIPGTPKDLLSYFMGLTDMSLKTWLIISTIARTPAIFISTFSGDAIVNKQYYAAIIIGVVLVVGSIVGGIYYKWLCDKENGKNK